jgi:hypothetical protein
MGKSSKHKLNTKSSTEAELVGASDYFYLTQYGQGSFWKQGFTIKQNTFYQDNQSAIRFEKNWIKSFGPNSRHIDIRYFFIKDRLEIEGFNDEYCPTEQMLADFFTKPLQGNLFRGLREVIMRRKHIDTPKEFTSARSQERLGKDVVSMKNETMADARRSDEKHEDHTTVKRTLTGCEENNQERTSQF